MAIQNELLAKAREKFPADDDYDKIVAAYEFADKNHAGQKRLSGEAYIIHPISVALILLDWDMDRDTIVAGLLHDVVEDTNTSLLEVEEKFGHDVAVLVDGVTKVGQARAGRDDIDTYLPRTKDNLTKLLVATGADVRVIIIKLADRLHNLRTLEYQPRDKQLKKARESLEIFGPLADRLNMGRVRVEIEDLSFKYLMPHKYAELKKTIDTRISRSKQSLEDVRREVSGALTREGISFRIDGRIKSVYSLYKKLNKHPNIDEIYDLIALRIITDDVTSCYLVLGVLHQMYQPLPGRIKDYISRPKRNGYQSLHTTVETPKGQIVEFQIRTKHMHEYAEHGLAAAFHYNEQKIGGGSYSSKGLAPMPKELKWIQDLQCAAGKLRAGEKVDLDDLKVSLFSDRIFVYTPKGDILDLPAGAMPLDFAYQVHSDVAAHATGFTINGKIARFDTPLKSGDVVEVITRRNVIPHVDWLNKIATAHARDKLRSQLKKAGRLKE